MIAIRRASATDAGAIGAIAEQAGLFPADALDDMMAAYLGGAQDERWLVAHDGDEVTGFCYCAAERFTEGTHNLLAIAAAPGRERKGVGAALVSAIEAELSQAGGRLLLVETSSQPQFAPTQAFYRAAGFALVATIPGYWAAHDDKIIFSKAIGPK